MKRLALTAPDLAKIAVFAAVICALALPGQFHLVGSAIPVTLQTLGVMLAGALLGAWRGFLAVLTYLAVGAIGLPVFAGGTSGLAPFTSQSGGYLFAFPLGALVIGLIVDTFQSRVKKLTVGPDNRSVSRAVRRAWNSVAEYAIWFVGCVIGGIALIYAIGVPVLAWRADLTLEDAVYFGAVIFLPGDLIKAVLATVVAAGVYRAYPPIAAYREQRRSETMSS